MSRGLNRNGDYRKGNPINTATKQYGNVVNWTPNPAEFGDPVNEPKNFGNPITLPHTYGNEVGGVPVTPTFDPPAGTYGVPQVIKILAHGNDAIYFTVDGTVPTQASRMYQGSVFIPSTETVRAISVTEGVPSSIGAAAYVISSSSQQATPTFSPVAGAYVGTQNVTITSAGADAIYYTTDGSTPTTGSTLYSGPVSVATSETVKALAVKAGFTDSNIGSASYTISAPVTPALVVAIDQYTGSFIATTDPVDTTGASLLVAVGSSAFGTGVTLSFADSLGNTWILLTNYGSTSNSLIAYCVNPTVGAGQTFTLSSSFGGDAVAISVAAFSGIATTAPLEGGSDVGSTSDNSLTQQPGAETAASVNDLIICANGRRSNDGVVTIDSGYTFATNSSHLTSACLAYLIAPDTNPVNPTVTRGSAAAQTCSAAIFKHA